MLDAHDPEAIDDYVWDWGAKRLAAGETITASTWSITPAGLTTGVTSADSTTTTIWLSGGKVGVVYHVTNHVTTSQGRQFDWTDDIACKEL